MVRNIPPEPFHLFLRVAPRDSIVTVTLAALELFKHLFNIQARNLPLLRLQHTNTPDVEVMHFTDAGHVA